MRTLAAERLAAWPACLLIFVLAGCRGSASNAREQAGPPAAAVALVQRGSIAHTLSLAGQFQPFQTVEVHAKVSGYIRHIYVDIGDRVRAGQTLAVLEVPELNAQYRGTQSEALRSKDAIAAAQGEVGRARSLHTALQANYDRLEQASRQQPGVIAAQELDNARSQAEASAAQMEAATAGLSGARQGADVADADRERVGALQAYSTVTAPLTGVVTWRYADTGALIQAGTASDTQSLPLVKIAQSDVLRLRVPVPEDAVRFVHEGDRMSIRVDALGPEGEDLAGKVVRFTRSLDPTTRTMETEVDVPNPGLRITPGMYANSALRLAHVEDVLTMPVGAVQGSGDHGTVLLLDGENRLRQRAVRLGLRGSLLVQVTGGLDVGDRVLVGDPGRFRVGEQVKPLVQAEPTRDVMREEGGVTDPFPASGAGSDSGASEGGA